GGWRGRALMGSELRGKTLGLVGCGNVGRLIAHKLSAWELAGCIGYDPYLTHEQLAASGIRKVELAELWDTADIISLHLPLTPETKHSVGAEEFARMKQGALLINAARGGVVDEAALEEALKSGKLCGAILDVFEDEPKVPTGLLSLPNVLLTPHIAGYTHEADKEVSLNPVREFLRRIAVQ
ncbi:phosphoglycerate dehydrogenase, partial [Candidatus Kaiserbacteria bacterium]|nr:phosphoglycerate dehydrogenase [Candidatus Kaiserbacteria bacterium]